MAESWPIFCGLSFTGALALVGGEELADFLSNSGGKIRTGPFALTGA